MSIYLTPGIYRTIYINQLAVLPDWTGLHLLRLLSPTSSDAQRLWSRRCKDVPSDDGDDAVD